jgi:D-glucosaminate-6-phosphate ammonia-lyase
MSISRVPALRLVLIAVVASIAAACSTMSSKPSSSAPPPPPAAAKVTDVTGTWELNVESPMGSRASDAIFTQTGETLGGKMVSPRGEVPLSGAIKGEAITFGLTVNVQGQNLQIDYTGTVTGDTMSGTVVFGSFGDGKWTGKRKQ